MTIFVLDASVVAKWFAQEPFADQASLLLDDRHQLHAPDFLLVEMDNVLATWVRRGALTRSAASEARAPCAAVPSSFTMRWPFSTRPGPSPSTPAPASTIPSTSRLPPSSRPSWSPPIGNSSTPSPPPPSRNTSSGSNRSHSRWLGNPRDVILSPGLVGTKNLGAKAGKERKRRLYIIRHFCFVIESAFGFRYSDFGSPLPSSALGNLNRFSFHHACHRALSPKKFTPVPLLRKRIDTHLDPGSSMQIRSMK